MITWTLLDDINAFDDEIGSIGTIREGEFHEGIILGNSLYE
jgi:hypothetical protein